MTSTGTPSTSIPSVVLNDDNTMPALGIGVAEMSEPRDRARGVGISARHIVAAARRLTTT